MVSNDLSKLNKRTLEVPRGLTYTYYTSPAKANKPTILLCHGFPDSATLWADAANNHLIPNGYGVIIPDLLGYGGTSKPTDPALYAFDVMSSDIVAILDAESIDKVISLGHDWGCGLAQRLYNYHPERVSGLVMMNVVYLPPTGEPFDLDAVLEMTQKFFNYGTYWYWKFFTAEDGPKIMNANLESSFDVCHAEPESWMDTLCKPDGIRNFITQGKRQPVQKYADGEHRRAFIERMGRDGFEAPVCWYKSMVQQYQSNAEKNIKEEAKIVQVPTFFWGGTRDVVCRPDLMGPAIQGGYVPKLTTKTVDEGHWAMLAQPETFGKDLLGWLGEHFG